MNFIGNGCQYGIEIGTGMGRLVIMRKFLLELCDREVKNHISSQ